MNSAESGRSILANREEETEENEINGMFLNMIDETLKLTNKLSEDLKSIPAWAVNDYESTMIDYMDLAIHLGKSQIMRICIQIVEIDQNNDQDIIMTHDLFSPNTYEVKHLLQTLLQQANFKEDKMQIINIIKDKTKWARLNRDQIPFLKLEKNK